MNFAIFNRSRRALPLLLLAALGLAACTSGTAPAPDKPDIAAAPQNAAPPVKTAPAPQKTAAGKGLAENVWASPIKTVGGETVKLADYKGKVLIVNFWATWCGPCREEMPHLVKLRQEFKDQGFEVVGVTHVGQDPDFEEVKAFAKGFKIPYPIGYAEANLILGIQGGDVRNSIPQSFIISRDGQVIKRMVGFGGDFPNIMRSVVTEALNEKAAG